MASLLAMASISLVSRFVVAMASTLLAMASSPLFSSYCSSNGLHHTCDGLHPTNYFLATVVAMASTLLTMASIHYFLATVLAMASTLLAVASIPLFSSYCSSNGLHPTSDGLHPTIF